MTGPCGQTDCDCGHTIDELRRQNAELREALFEIEQIGHNPADLASDLIGLEDRYEQLANRLALIAFDALAKEQP